jgi:hypothetical protein
MGYRLRDLVAIAFEAARDVESAPAGAGDHLVDERQIGSSTRVAWGAAEELDEPLEVLGALAR